MASGVDWKRVAAELKACVPRRATSEEIAQFKREAGAKLGEFLAKQQIVRQEAERRVRGVLFWL